MLTIIVTQRQCHAKPKALVHVGSFKTATTWLQSLLFAFLAKGLIKENYHPVLLTEREKHSYQNADLAHCLFRTSPMCVEILEQYKQELLSHSAAGHNVYLSSEMFSAAKLDIPLLFELLKDFDISIILVYRDYLHQFESFHNQIYKTGQFKMNFVSFVSKCRDILKCTDFYLAAKDVIYMYLKYINKTQIQVFDFNGIKNQNLDIAETIIRHSFSSLSAKFLMKLSHTIEKLKTKQELVETEKNVFNRGTGLIHADLYNIAKLLRPYDMNGINVESCLQRFLNMSLAFENLPLECLNQEEYENLVQISLKLDQEMREKYADLIIYGNETANVNEIHMKLNYNVTCALDRNQIMGNRTLKAEIISHYTKCRNAKKL